jgi:hypothetical protein
MPGDGSESGWRTPILTWRTFRGPLVRCGNRNGLKPEEVFTLEPGEWRTLAAHCGLRAPEPLFAGRYRYTVRYENIPDLKWDGMPLRKDDPEAQDRVRRSDRVRVVSNTVEVIVK